MSGYLIYARKSTESEDRQILSIDSQIRELETFAHAQNLPIESVITESQSAKAPGREGFADLLQRVRRRRSLGVLCWKLDRLARNPVDGSALIWAMELGEIRDIVTPQRTFSNTGNDKFWMQLEFGIAKKYVDDLSDNVKRGNRAKLELGWLPGSAPIGYLNDVATKSIVPDPDRFPIVRKIWDHLLRGVAPTTIRRLASDEWGLRTRRTTRRGGRPLATSSFYRIAGNPFYYGLLVRNGDTYPGAHKPMISKDEFDTVQQLLGRPNHLESRKHRFAFTGLIRCGQCGAMVTAERKTNRFGSQYTYYHCTHRRRGAPCHQPVVQAEALTEQIAESLGRIRISARLQELALRRLRALRAKEVEAVQATQRTLEETRAILQQRLNALTDLRIAGHITEEEFLGKRKVLVAEELQLRERSSRTTEPPAWFEPSTNTFQFAHEAQKRFLAGSLEERREILCALRSNLTLRDKVLRIELAKPFLLLEKGLHNCNPQGLVDEIRTFFAQHPRIVQWPWFCRREDRTRTGDSTARPPNGNSHRSNSTRHASRSSVPPG